MNRGIGGVIVTAHSLLGIGVPLVSCVRRTQVSESSLKLLGFKEYCGTQRKIQRDVVPGDLAGWCWGCLPICCPRDPKEGRQTRVEDRGLSPGFGGEWQLHFHFRTLGACPAKSVENIGIRFLVHTYALKDRRRLYVCSNSPTGITLFGQW